MTELIGGHSYIALTAPDEFDWPSVEKACGSIFNDEQRDRLSVAVSRYLSDSAFEISTPSSKEIRKRLKAISRHSKGLAEALSTRSAADEEAVNCIWPYTVDLAIAKKLLWDLSTLSASRLLLKGRPGRRRHTALSGLTIDVQSIWHDAGNSGNGCYWHEAKGCYAGRVLDLVSSLLSQVPGAESPEARTIYETVSR